jgi:hypothetical protein
MEDTAAEDENGVFGFSYVRGDRFSRSCAV